jgi:hypothetical protein
MGVRGTINDQDDKTSAYSSSAEMEDSRPGGNTSLITQAAFWSRETQISCVCGASFESCGTCLLTMLDFAPDNGSLEQLAERNQSGVSSSACSFSTSELQVRETRKPPAPTRKEVLHLH